MKSVPRKAALGLLLFAGLCQADKAGEHAQHGGYQKPGADIRVASPSALDMAPNSAQSVQVRFHTPKRGSLTLHATAKAGLTLADAATPHTYDLSQGAVELPLHLSSGEAGIYHLMFHASIDQDGSSTSRVFGIPVYVGDRDVLMRETQQKTQPEVIIMKGEETIR